MSLGYGALNQNINASLIELTSEEIACSLDCSLRTMAMLYRVNPYDQICDFYPDVGFKGDLERISFVYSRIVQRTDLSPE